MASRNIIALMCRWNFPTSAVGGVTTFATTFFNQRYVARREMLVKDVANREELYAEFLKEVADLYKESLNQTLDDLSRAAFAHYNVFAHRPHPNDQQ